MVLNPWWMPRAYVWFCWLICDYSSHWGPNYLWNAPCHPFQGWGLLIDLSLSHSLSSSNPPPSTPRPSFSLSGLNLVTECTCPIIPAQNLPCWKSSHNSGPAGVDLFCFGCLFYTTEWYWAQGTGNPELLSFSLKFSVSVCQVKAPAWSASKFNGPGKAGVR